MNDKALIAVNNVKKYYLGGEVKALDGVNLEINKGEVVVIIGPSGSGKSTMLRSLNLLEVPTDGHIVFDGEDLTNPKLNINKHRQKMGMVFQHFNLFPNMTILRNLTIAPMKLLKKSQADAEAKALELLDAVGLRDRADAYPSQLSGGQKQRVAIARALMLNPDILCFDEPTSALDPELTGEVLNVIKNLKDEGSTMIVVTHEMEFAKNVSDKIMFMADGVVEEIGTPEQIYENPQSEKTKTFLANSLEKF